MHLWGSRLGALLALDYSRQAGRSFAGPADFNAALRRGAIEARQAGVAIVLSDFLDPAGYEVGLNALVGRGFQVNAVQILAPDELAPKTFGDLRLVDSESGGTQEVEGQKYDVLKMSLESVGLTPGDRYNLYIDPQTHMVMRWDYMPSTEKKTSGTWEDYQKFGPLTLATKHHFGDRQINLTDVSVKTD